MEGIKASHIRVGELRERIKSEVGEIHTLEKHLAEGANRLRRNDLVGELDSFRASVCRRVEDVRSMENAAHSGFTKANIYMAAAGFGLGCLIGLANRPVKKPLSLGAELAQKPLNRSVPFGKVMVAISLKDTPHNVEVISISERARKQGISEEEVMAEMEGKGFLLMTPESFIESLERLKRELLEGKTYLPVL